MEYLSNGTVLQTSTHIPVTITKKLGEGGQGIVYLVKYGVISKALKIYKPETVKNLDWFYKNLTIEIEAGMPSNKFIWPEALCEWLSNDGTPRGGTGCSIDEAKERVAHGQTFGYLMPLRSEEFVDFSELLLAKKEFSCFNAAIDAAIRIVSAFNVLHMRGMCYQDLNDGNFFVKLSNGDVRICDNDNASHIHDLSGIAGKARYMAPSVVMGGKPSYTTDRFSLAVCLFLLFVRTHPLEGVRTLSVPEMNDYFLQKCYGSDPIFIADPTDNSNGPNRSIDGVSNFYVRWPLLSSGMRDLFTRAFSKKAMLENENLFPSERDWMRELLKYRSTFIKCPACGYETIYSEGHICPLCNSHYTVYGSLKAENYILPIVKGNYVSQEHLDDFSDTSIQFVPRKIGVVKVNEQKRICGLLNMSDRNWIFAAADGKPNTLRPNETMVLTDGMTINIGNDTITVNM